MMAMVVPNEAANDSGISNLEAGILLSRERFITGGSMMAVMVTWWVKAESSATDGIITAMMRSKLRPANRWTQYPSLSDNPVWYSAPLNTNTAATIIAGSLLNPDKASSGVSTPDRLSARMIKIATRSMRIHSVRSRMMAPIRMANKSSWGICRPKSMIDIYSFFV